MVVCFGVSRDAGLFNEVKDCCTDCCHRDETWLYVAERAGRVGQYVVLVVACVIDAGYYLSRQEDVAEFSFRVDVRSCRFEGGLGSFL